MAEYLEKEPYSNYFPDVNDNEVLDRTYFFNVNPFDINGQILNTVNSKNLAGIIAEALNTRKLKREDSTNMYIPTSEFFAKLFTESKSISCKVMIILL